MKMGCELITAATVNQILIRLERHISFDRTMYGSDQAIIIEEST